MKLHPNTKDTLIMLGLLILVACAGVVGMYIGKGIRMLFQWMF